MGKLVSTVGMSREDWLAYRKLGIGGSDSGAICGVNPYSSAISVYMDKTSDEVEEPDSESMRQGRDLEEYVARRFCEATGKKVRRSNYIYQHDEYPWMLANIDRMVVGEDAGLECKTASAFNADKFADGRIPEHYAVQMAHYMAVTGAKAWYLAVAILGRDFKWFRVERDDELIESLIQIEEQFWNGNVIPRILPDPDGSKVYDDVLERYFGPSKKISIPLVGFDEKLKRRDEITELQEKLKKEQAEIDQELKLYMEGNEQAESDRYRVTWSTFESSRFDTARLKEEEPSIYNRFLKRTQGRRFGVRRLVPAGV